MIRGPFGHHRLIGLLDHATALSSRQLGDRRPRHGRARCSCGCPRGRAGALRRPDRGPRGGTRRRAGWPNRVGLRSRSRRSGACRGGRSTGRSGSRSRPPSAAGPGWRARRPRGCGGGIVRWPRRAPCRDSPWRWTWLRVSAGLEPGAAVEPEGGLDGDLDEEGFAGVPGLVLSRKAASRAAEPRRGPSLGKATNQRRVRVCRPQARAGLAFGCAGTGGVSGVGRMDRGDFFLVKPMEVTLGGGFSGHSGRATLAPHR